MTENTNETHEIEVTSVREYTGSIEISNVKESDEYVDYSMRFDEETKRTYECTCDDRFQKDETAIEHLEGVMSVEE